MALVYFTMCEGLFSVKKAQTFSLVWDYETGHRCFRDWALGGGIYLFY